VVHADYHRGAVRPEGATVSIIGWILLGLIAGFVASKVVNKSGEGVLLDIVLGIVGAIVGGFLFAQFGAQGVTGFNLYSMFVAVIGAIIVLVISRRRRPPFDLTPEPPLSADRSGVNRGSAAASRSTAMLT
jgi:uncharacterized membrane protein YeaQ/YmgE (transglycosylase-associated protein family)